MTEKQSLEERVQAFHMRKLPGQPNGMHMGTSYLVNDLWLEVTRLRNALAIMKAEASIHTLTTKSPG